MKIISLFAMSFIFAGVVVVVIRDQKMNPGLLSYFVVGLFSLLAISTFVIAVVEALH